ncbi:tyrosine-type recombinase/integrase [Sulfuricurvum sp.]|uniref:tyrosine-type recombinase/integrase n=1 Tax=Sulfuricurvum sp. TaxID=2025608 RepID=UPI00261D1D65|nr:tyrosine-type recombinase/integrase [Sulfuricurvum sp.]MDD3597292.1 tyrosine-type recombinase/integrase [Sulfuricurvum sp.]
MAIIFKDYVQVTHKGNEIPSLKIHKSDDTKFMFDLRINGKRTRKTITVNGSTRGKNIELAKFALDQFTAEESKKSAHSQSLTASPNMTVTQYFNRLVEIKRNNWSQSHQYGLNNFFHKYIEPIIGDKAISAVKSSDLTTIGANVSHLSKRMQKRLLEVMNPLIELAIEDESIQVSPIKKSHRVTRKLTEEKKVILNAVDKYKRVHKSIMSVYQDNPTIRAMLLFGFYGRRKNEVLSLKWENVDLKHNTFMIPKEESKVGVDLEFSLPDEIKTALKEIATYTGKEGLVFKSPRGGQYTEIRDHIYAIRNDTGIEEFGFHWMRNLAVSALSSQGVDAIHLSALLGHTDTHTVKQYLSLQRKEASGLVQEVSKGLLCD